MTTQVLTPTQQVPDGAGLDLTALLTLPTGTTLQFANTGKEVLYVASSGTATVTVDVGALVDGQTVTNFATVTPTSAHTVMFGPFRSVLDNAGTSTIQVTLSAVTGLTVALIQNVGVI